MVGTVSFHILRAFLGMLTDLLSEHPIALVKDKFLLDLLMYTF